MNPDLAEIVRALDRLTAALQKGALDYIGTFAISGTLIALIWYTVETCRLRKATQAQRRVTANLLREARKQNETAVMPILAIAVCGPPALGLNELVFKNIGTGPAFNVSIDGCKTSGAELRFEFEETVLVPGDTHKLPFELITENRPKAGSVHDLLGLIKVELLRNPLKITVRCRSVGSIDYAFTFGLSPSEGRLKVAFEGMESSPRT